MAHRPSPAGPGHRAGRGIGSGSPPRWL